MNSLREIIRENKIVSILRGIEKEKVIKLVEVLKEEGIKIFEITLNTKDCFEIYSEIKEKFGKEIYLGLGTVNTLEECKKAHKLGVDFFLTPALNEDVLKYSVENNINILPGVFTPTDMLKCLSYGIETLKLFPAADLPLSYVKNVKGPLDNIELVAVGGVDEHNLSDFLKAGYIGAGIGSSLADKELIKNSDWDGLRIKAKKFTSVL